MSQWLRGEFVGTKVGMWGSPRWVEDADLQKSSSY